MKVIDLRDQPADVDTSTPEGFREARRALGLSQSGCAEALGVKSARTIRKWEAGEKEIAGPAIVAMRLLLQGIER